MHPRHCQQNNLLWNVFVGYCTPVPDITSLPLLCQLHKFIAEVQASCVARPVAPWRVFVP
jgi:hypothetical protein